MFLKNTYFLFKYVVALFQKRENVLLCIEYVFLSYKENKLVFFFMFINSQTFYLNKIIFILHLFRIEISNLTIII